MSAAEKLPQKSLAEILDITEERFKRVTHGMNYDAEKGYAIQLLNNNEFLKKVAFENPASLQQAMTNVAAIGLSLNPAKKQAYLITRSVKTANGYQQRVFLDPSYMGLCDIATGTGIIKWVQSNCVYLNDEFTDNGAGEKPTHVYNAFKPISERGDFVGVYCVAKTSDGDYLTTIMQAEDVYSIRGRSEAYKRGGKGPWASDFNQMAMKSVVRQAFKMWPKSDRMKALSEAVEISNENEGFEPIVNSPPLNEYTAGQKEYIDKLISDGDKIRMACFWDDLDEGVQISLYHSFEKGTKGKYQKVINDLAGSGRAQVNDCLKVIEDAEQSGDDIAAKEIIEDLPQEAIDRILTLADDQTGSFIRQLISEAA